MQQKNKGVTLIALIVTIIILVILAAISLNAIWSDNGILKKAQEASKLQEIAEVKEKLELAVLAVQSEIAEDKTREELANLVDITTENVQSKLEEGITVQIGSTEDSVEGTPQKIATITTNGKTYTFIMKEDMSIETLDENEVILSYIFSSYLKADGKSIDVDLKFTCMNGINKIQFPDGTEENQDNNSMVTKTGVTLQLNTDYTYTITTKDGTIKTKTINIKPENLPLPELTISNIIIGNSKTATASVEDNSQDDGTTLYIRFTATTNINIIPTIVPTVPYSITKNGIYDFEVSYTYAGIEHKKKIPVEVKKYTLKGSYVQYDAGIWTQEEINSLTEQGLYDVSTKTEGRFGDFIAGTSRNASVQKDGFNMSPQYSGWKILQSEVREGKTYVTKLVHAGASENFFYRGHNYMSEYILSSGQRQKEYPYTYNEKNQSRNWDMYKDKTQIHLIDNVHCMTLEEAMTITGRYGVSVSNTLQKTGSHYMLATVNSNGGSGMEVSNQEGQLHVRSDNVKWGIRPVIELVEGVQIVSGIGSEEEPYVLKK